MSEDPKQVDGPEEAFINQDDVLEVIEDNDEAPPVSDDESDNDVDMGDGAAGASTDVLTPDRLDPNLIKDKSIQGFFDHSEPVYCVAAHPSDAALVATGGGDDLAYIWNSLTGDTLHKLGGHTDSVVSIAFNHNGEFVATGSMDGTVKLWNTETGAEVETLSGPGDAIEWLKWHPKGNVLVAGSADTTMWMWNVPGANCMNVFAGHADAVLDGMFISKGKRLASVGADGSMRIWDPRSAECTHLVAGELFHEGAVLCLDEHPTNPIIITGSEDSKVCLTNYETGKVVGQLEGHTDAVEAVGFSHFAGGMTLACSASLDGKAIIWDLNTMQQRQVLKHDGGVVKLLWHPTSSMLSTGSLDGAVRLWDGRTGTIVEELTGHGAHVLGITYDPTGTRLYSVSEDNTGLVFSLESQGEEGTDSGAAGAAQSSQS
eukprot:TRINITY_DN23589_c0_g1_i1.p1 TRINITY_DN23589_c0_g1~~TRINITY_DN23589_c0_g1_i1.p1  ORF type:complete len:430 (-),score=74.79 TRINITY_DN23589_c0_g1_i1:93-1382(-)